MTENAAPTPPNMAELMMAVFENLKPIEEGVRGYKASLIDAGWNESEAEAISAHLLIQMNSKVLGS